MLYLPDLRLCFLHVPKTAGTWVRMAIRGTGLAFEEFGAEHEHADLEQAEQLLPPGTTCFTAVRHPFAWLRSYWVDRQLKGWGGDLQIGHHCKNDNFDLFVRTVCNLKKGYITELFDRYVGLCGGAQSLFIMRSESIEEGLRDSLYLAAKRERKCVSLDRLTTLQPLNLGAAYPHFHKATEGTPELFELVKLSEPRLYTTFGYAAEPPARVQA